MKRIAVLGSTGSIGRSTLDVIRRHCGELQLTAIAAHSDIDGIEAQVREFEPKHVALWDEEKARALSLRLNGRKVLSGDPALELLASSPDVDVVVIATSCSSALPALIKAIDSGKQIALASKELLVIAGSVLMERARRKGVSIMPIDSEHAALFQCLQGVDPAEVETLTVTGSGGPLWEAQPQQLETISLEQVLDHPKWKMGKKITVDSATLMNKGLEIIEARWLFGFDLSRLRVVIHPEAVIHAMIELKDGSLLAQMCCCDMRLPIQSALSYPERWESSVQRLDLTAAGPLNFYKPDLNKFPCLALAWKAAATGQSACAVLNGANDTAVQAYLNDAIAFTDIPKLIAAILSRHSPLEAPDLDALVACDRWARETAKEWIEDARNRYSVRN